jgi:hypothetical protein
MCSIAAEHASSVRQLYKYVNYTSPICIIRSQFEALTQGMWLIYAASDLNIENTMKTLSELSDIADQKPNNADMIKALEGKAPKQAVAILNEFRDVKWKVLNSYMHGGIHQLQRHGAGYPEQLMKGIIKSPNGLLTMAAILTDNELIVKDITKIQCRHKECLPKLLT